jgi:hypothetical protein
MGTSAIEITSLTATDDINGIKLTWALGDPWPIETHYSTDAVEIWAATVNNFASGSKVGEAPPTSEFLHVGLDRGEARYYWARARDKLGDFGPYFPVSTTAGVEGIEKSGDVDSLIAQDGYYVHRSGLIEQWGRASLPGGASLTVTFPRAFPASCFQVVATPFAVPSTTTTYTATVSAFDVNGMDVMGNQISAGVVSAPAMTVLWRALGF